MIYYLCIQFTLVAVWTLARVALFGAARFDFTRRAIGFRDQLFLFRALLGATLVAPAAAIWFVRQADWQGALQLNQSSVVRVLSLLTSADRSILDLSEPGVSAFTALLALFGVGCLIFAAHAFVHYFRLAAVLDGAAVLRRCGRVVVASSDVVSVPFSMRTLRRHWVVVPNHMLAQHEEWRLAMAHELQHHRQLDTSWAWISVVLSILFWPNPAFFFWQRWQRHIQELACDEALRQKPRFDAVVYARCLLAVAERADSKDSRFAFAPSMAAHAHPMTHLHHRIEQLFVAPAPRLPRSLFAAATVVTLACGIGVGGFAAGLSLTTGSGLESPGDAPDAGAMCVIQDDLSGRHDSMMSQPECDELPNGVK